MVRSVHATRKENMLGIMLSILILTGINPRVAPDRMSTFTFSGGYGNRTGNNVVSGSIALRTNLVVHLTRSLEIGLDGGFYNIEQEGSPGCEEYQLRKGIIHAGIIGRYISPGSIFRFFLEIESDNTDEGVLQEVAEDSLYIWCNGSEISVGACAGAAVTKWERLF